MAWQVVPCVPGGDGVRFLNISNPSRSEYLAVVRAALGHSRLTLKERAAILLAAEACADDRQACWDGHSFGGVACPVKRAGFVPTYARFDRFVHSYDKTMRSLVGLRGPGIVGIRPDGADRSTESEA